MEDPREYEDQYVVGSATKVLVEPTTAELSIRYPSDNSPFNQDVAKGGAKFDNGKPRFSLLPWGALEAIVQTYNYGARKYSSRNWERGIVYSRIFDAAIRHLTAWWDGEENDPESGLSHLAHAGFNVITLLAYQIYWPYRVNIHTEELFDDRPTGKQ